MTPREAHDAADVPAGTDAEETVDDGAVLAEAAGDSTGDQALADAGLPTEGETAEQKARRAPARSSLAHRLYNGEAGLDVVNKRRFWFKVTGVVVLVCVLLIVFRGFNFGIEFAGGNSIRVPAESSQLSEVRQAAED